jgi:hypothetical protein
MIFPRLIFGRDIVKKFHEGEEKTAKSIHFR